MVLIASELNQSLIPFFFYLSGSVLSTYITLCWGSHLVLAASTPAIFGRRGETLEAAGGQEDEGGEASG